MNRTHLCAAAAFALLGCATTKSEEKASWSEVTQQPVVTGPRKFDAREFAERKLQPKACEEEAKMLYDESADNGWAALNVCLQNPNFTLLNRVMAEPWVTELGKRKDALPFLARLVANRGGTVDRDVAVINQQRLPLFAFGAAMAQPDTYKGRYVLIRAKVSDIKNAANATTVRLAEFSLGSAGFEYDIGPARRSTSNYNASSSRSSAMAASGSYNTTKYGSGSARGSLASSSKSSYSGSGSYESKTVGTQFDNVSNETGRAALGRLVKPDPFLVPEREYIVLARFDGTRMADGGGEDGDEKVKVGVLTVVTYFEPSGLVVE